MRAGLADHNYSKIVYWLDMFYVYAYFSSQAIIVSLFEGPIANMISQKKIKYVLRGGGALG